MHAKSNGMEVFVVAGCSSDPTASLFRQNSANVAHETALLIPYGCPAIRAEIIQ